MHPHTGTLYKLFSASKASFVCHIPIVIDDFFMRQYPKIKDIGGRKQRRPNEKKGLMLRPSAVHSDQSEFIWHDHRGSGRLKRPQVARLLNLLHFSCQPAMSSSYTRSRSPVRRSETADKDRYYDRREYSDRRHEDRRDRSRRDYEDSGRSGRRSSESPERSDRKPRDSSKDKDINNNDSSSGGSSNVNGAPEQKKKRVPISIEELIQKKEQEKNATIKVSPD